MDDGVRVRGDECVQHGVNLRRDLRERARSVARDQVRHRAALGELHRVPRDVSAAVPVVDRDDGRMRELRGEPCLAPKTRDG